MVFQCPPIPEAHLNPSRSPPPWSFTRFASSHGFLPGAGFIANHRYPPLYSLTNEQLGGPAPGRGALSLTSSSRVSSCVVSPSADCLCSNTAEWKVRGCRRTSRIAGTEDPDDLSLMVLWMDVCKAQPHAAVAQRKVAEENLRPPLAPSEKNNAAPAQRKPRTREVTSRYKSGITPLTIPPPSTSAATQRCPSPNVGRTALSPTPPLPKRSQSAERRTPRTPTFRASTPWSPSRSPASCSPSSKTSTPVRDVTAEMQPSSRRSGVGRTADGLWPSMRSLSASFLKVSLSTPLGNRDERISNSDPSPDHSLKSLIHAVSQRKKATSRGKDASFQSENFKPVENIEARAAEPQRWPGQMSASFSARAMSRSMDFNDGAGRAPTMLGYLRGPSPTRRVRISGEHSRGAQRTAAEVTRAMSLDGSGQMERELSAAMGTSVYHLERAPSSTRPNRTLSVPLFGSPCPSPTRKPSSPSSSSCRSMASPCRSISSTPASSKASFSRTGIQSSVISYFANLRKGKRSAGHIEDAHQLRILENRYLQWRFVNARAHAAMSIQRITSKVGFRFSHLVFDVLLRVLLCLQFPREWCERNFLSDFSSATRVF